MDRNRYYEQERKVSQIHRICYRDFTIKVKKERTKDRYEDLSRLSDESLVQRKAGRSSLNEEKAQEKAEKTIVLRSQSCSFNKYLRIICQECGSRLHDVEFIATGQKMYVAEKYCDKETFYRRMNHITSAILQIHLQFWAAAKQQIALIDKSYASQKIDAKPNLIADIKMISILKTELSDPSHKVITTNQVESKYRHLLVKHGLLEAGLHKSYNKYLKNLIEKTFKKLPQAN